MTFASANKDPKPTSYRPISAADRECYEQCKQIDFTLKLIIDDPEKYEGGPVGLQVIGRRFEEEKVLEILEVIQRAIGAIE